MLPVIHNTSIFKPPANMLVFLGFSCFTFSQDVYLVSMENIVSFNNKLAWMAGGLIIILVCLFLLPWQNIHWGTINISPAQTVMVTGTAKTQIKNQVASFTAGVSSVDINKETAITQVNASVQKVIEAVKTFGIATADIQTANISIYQEEEPVDTSVSRRTKPGQWRVSNTITVKLRDISRASEFTDLLSSSGATNVYGPNFSIENVKNVDQQLYVEAMQDAKIKAQAMASAGNHKLGAVVSISEGGTSGIIQPFAKDAIGGLGGAAPIEPGSQDVTKSLTVIFELR